MLISFPFTYDSVLHDKDAELVQLAEQLEKDGYTATIIGVDANRTIFSLGFDTEKKKTENRVSV